MKRFKTKKHGIEEFKYSFILICVFSFLFIKYYNDNISVKILNITKYKLDEATTLLIKKDITPLDVDLNKLLDLTLNKNEEIVYMDINLNEAYKLTYDKISKIQNNIHDLENGNLNIKGSLKSKDGIIYTLVNLGLSDKGVLFSNIGPKIPVKIEFYEHVLGTIDAEVKSYGINNAIVNVYLTVSLDSKIIIPYDDEIVKKDYKLLIASKVINGSVPTIYGGALSKSVEIR